MTFLSWFIILTVFDIIAVISARLYIDKKKEVYRLISIFLFALSAYVFVQLMEYQATAIINILWVSLSTIFIAIGCYFLFDEKINRWQSLGMVLILGGMIFL